MHRGTGFLACGLLVSAVLVADRRASNTTRAPAEGGAYLQFAEGNPGSPGDGLIVNASGASNNQEFHLTPGLRFSEVTDGVTFVVFPPPGAVKNVAEIVGGFDTSAPAKSGGCRAGFSSSFPLRTFPTVSVNGVTGAVITIPRVELELVVATTERSRSCGFAFDDFVIDKIRFTASGRLVNALDAVAFGASSRVPPL